MRKKRSKIPEEHEVPVFKRSVLLTRTGDAWNADTPEDAKRSALALLESTIERDRRHVAGDVAASMEALNLVLEYGIYDRIADVIDKALGTFSVPHQHIQETKT